jgi:hypothetical protein
MSDLVPDTVNQNTERLVSSADDLGKSIAALKAKVQELAETIGDVPDPEATAKPAGEEVAVVSEEAKEDDAGGAGEIYGSMEVAGGTFTTDKEVHGALRHGIVDIFDIKQGEGIYGASDTSVEVMALEKIGHAAEDIKANLKGVEDSLVNRLTNLQSLKNVMNTTIEKMVEIVKSNDSNGTGESNAKIIKDVHDKLNDEFNNQMKSLQNVLNLKIKPTANDLMALIKDNNKFHVLAERLGVGYNTPEASDRLALAYTNMSRLQINAKKVEDALKTLEISLDKYKSLKSSSELQKVLSEVLKNSTNGKSTETLSKVLSAIKTLKSSFGNHSKIIKELKGAMEFEGGDYNTGVGRVRNTTAKSTLKTRVKTYENTVKELFKNFISQVGSNFKDIKKSAEAISEKLGNDITYDDDVKLFISIFEGFNSDLNNGKLFYALISLDQSMAGKELKTRFMDNLNSLIESLSVLEKYPYLSDVKKQLTFVKENVDTYSDTVLNVRSNEESLKSGRSDFSWSDTLVDPSIPASVSNTIKETITKLKFFGNLSMLKENLNRVSKEYPEMQTGYDKLLGKSIGTKLSELQKEYTESVDRLNDTERGRGFVLKTYNNDPANASEKIPKGLVETIYKLQYESKVGLYKTVEAVDLYLMKFTEKVANNVEALKELNSLLSQTELISAWADTSSLTNIQTLLELVRPDTDRLISHNVAHDLGLNETIKVKSFTTGEDIRKVLEASKKSIESVAVLRNLIAMFIKIGDKFGDSSLSKESYMSAGTMYNNLVKYIWVSAYTMGYGTGGGDTTAEIDSDKKDKNGYEKETGDKPSFFDVKMTLCNQPLDILGSYEKKILTRVDHLMNLVTPAAKQAVDGMTEDQLRTLQKAAIHTYGNPLLAPDENGFVLAISGQSNSMRDNDIRAAGDDFHRHLYMSLKKIKEDVLGKDIFRTEDKYFILALKAMSAKVLTVVGISNLLTQPSKVSSMITNPIRSIIGAAETEVVDGAVELYIRLPLLLEFYKNVFDNGNEKYKKNKYANDDSETIAFIPEVGSVWSGLIQCVFDDSKQISNGIYSLENMKRIITEVNKIYKNYSGVEDAKLARTVVLDLISEINRRYGVLKRKEIDEFYQTKKKYTSNMGELSGNANDYDILDAGDDDIDMGPSSEFTSSTINMTSSKNKTESNDIQLVKEFRDLISKELYSQDLATIGNKSFSERVKFFKNEVKRASSQQAKVEVIIKAIDDSSNVNSHNGDIVLLYHELVRYPLVNLQKVYRHQMTAMIKLYIAVYKTLLGGAINNSTQSKAVYLLASKIDMDANFNTNKNSVNTRNLVLNVLRSNLVRLGMSDNNANITTLNKFETAAQRDARRQRAVDDMSQAVVDAENAILDAAPLDDATTNARLVAAVNAYIAYGNALTGVETRKVAVATAPDDPTRAAAQLRLDADEAALPALYDAYILALDGPVVANTITAKTPRGIRDVTQGIPHANRVNIVREAKEQLDAALVAVPVVQATIDRFRMRISALTNDNAIHMPTTREAAGVFNPAGATIAEKTTNAYNSLMTMANNAWSQGKKTIDDALIRAKAAAIAAGAAVTAVFTHDEIKDIVNRQQKAVFSVSKALGKFIKSKENYAAIKPSLLNNAKADELANLIDSVDKTPEETDLYANVKLYLEIISWLCKENNLNDPNVNLISESILKMAKSFKVERKVDDATEDIHSFYNIIGHEIVDCRETLTKEKLLKFFLENFSCSGCQLKFVASDKYVMDYSKLQTTVENNLESTKYFLSKMRNQLSDGLIKSAEKHINNLEDNYLNKMIYNQDTELTPIFDAMNFEQLNTILSSVIQNANLSIDTSNLYGIIVSDSNVFSSGTEVYGNNGILSNRNMYTNILKESMKTYMSNNRQWKAFNDPTIADNSNPVVLSDIFDSNVNTKEGSILIKFNNLVARYLETFFEVSSKKFYMNLLTEFMKNQNSAIFGGNGLSDGFSIAYRTINDVTFPKNDAVLSEMLGFVIKTFANRSQNKQLQTKYHAQVAISEVSANMVEKYKAHLPVFISLFEKLIEQCAMYKKLLEVSSPSEVNGTVSDSDIQTVSAVMFGDEDAEKFSLLGSWVRGNAQAYSHFNNILNNIMDASRALVNDSSVVLKEIDFNPQFFEIKNNSIKNFYSNISKLPVMPNSVLSNSVINHLSFMPEANGSDAKIKLMYGLNYVLNNKTVASDLNNFLWLKEFLTSYNSSTPKVNNINLDKMGKYLLSTNGLAKIIYEYEFLNKTVSTNTFGVIKKDLSFANAEFNRANGNAVGVKVDHHKLDTYYSVSGRTMNEILSITENSSIEANKKLITDFVSVSTAKEFNRVNARLMNIIDMNISPINPHALLREIPLINVYNYAFTFDDIVSKDFGFSSNRLYTSDAEGLDDFVDGKKNATAVMLLDPYYAVNKVLNGVNVEGPTGKVVVPNDVLDPNDMTYVSRDILARKTIGELKHSMSNVLPAGRDHKVAFGYPKYIKDITNLCNDTHDLRFNTKFTRNMLFITNLHRYLLFKIKNEIERVDSKRVSSSHITSSKITAFDSAGDNLNNKQDEFDYLMI